MTRKTDRPAKRAAGESRYVSPAACKRGHRSARTSANGTCIACAKLHQQRYTSRLRAQRPSKFIWWNARARALRERLPFTITEADCAVPLTCPVLGIPLKVNRGAPRAGSPSLDRMFPHMGYVPSNVRVISFKANRIKCDATIDEVRAVLHWMER